MIGTIIFIVVTFIFLVALVIALLVIKRKNQSNSIRNTHHKKAETDKKEDEEKDKKNLDIIKTTFGIDKIFEDGTIKLTNGLYRRIYEISSLDYELLNESEKDAFELALLGLARSITFPMMYFTFNSRVDIDEPLLRIQKFVTSYEADENEKLKMYAQNLIRSLKNIQHERGIVMRRNFVVIGTAKALTEKKALTELDISARALANGLAPAKVSVSQLNMFEVLQLLADILNKHTPKIQEMFRNGVFDLSFNGIGVVVDVNEE